VWASLGGILEAVGAESDTRKAWLFCREVSLEWRNIPRNSETEISRKERPVELDLLAVTCTGGVDSEVLESTSEGGDVVELLVKRETFRPR
jgi:hypothetical protein